MQFGKLVCKIKDHPRACGEQIESKGMRQIVKGSPPRVRGTAVIDERQAKKHRITPARAGNSQRLSVCLSNT